MADLSLNINGKDNASPALNSAAGSLGKFNVAAGAAAAAVVAFSKASLESFEAAERADRRLQRAAGDLTETFIAQADALEATLGVNGDAVQEMQALLLTYGAAPSQIEATTKAMLDYAAFTGEDAVAATRQLISSVDGGKVAFKELGVTYDATGSKTRDLEAATAGLAKAVGGSAQSESESLTGSAARAEAQFGKLQESWGRLVADFVTKTGVVDSARFALEKLTETISGPGATQKRENLIGQLQKELKTIDEFIKTGPPTNAQILAGAASYNDMLDRRADIVRRLIEIEQKDRKPEGPEFLGSDVTTKGRGEQKRAAEEHRRAMEDAERNHAEAEEAQMKRAKEDFRNLRDLEDHEADRQAKLEKDKLDAALAETKRQQEGMNHELEQAEKHNEKLARLASEKLKQEAADLKSKEELYARAGDALGAALINSMGSALERAAAGEDLDPEEMAAEVASQVLTLVGGVIGTIYGMPQVGAAVGGAAGSLLKGAVRGGKKRRHDGGWIDAPRYHGGAWVGTDEQPAILQTGERVLSRADVAAMGGPGRVDSAVRGGRGGGVNVYVSTLDGGTAADFFARNGTAAMLKNYRLNRGIAWGGT